MTGLIKVVFCFWIGYGLEQRFFVFKNGTMIVVEDDDDVFDFDSACECLREEDLAAAGRISPGGEIEWGYRGRLRGASFELVTPLEYRDEIEAKVRELCGRRLH